MDNPDQHIEPPAFLLEHLPFPVRSAPSSTAPPSSHAGSSSTGSATRPHITLTWAQSLDAKIAGPGGARVILSGPESMLMTHWMRAMHGAIMVGIGTILMDDPRLQINLLPQNRGLVPPQPIILDPTLRFPLPARLLSEWNRWKGSAKSGVRQPWVICGRDVDINRRQQVEGAGVRVIPVELDDSGRIAPESLPDVLASLGIDSIMIEGGSKVLSSFLHAGPRADGNPTVDSIIVTVAPQFIGEGVGVVPAGEDSGLPRLRTLHTETMGKDAVMVCDVDLAPS